MKEFPYELIAQIILSDDQRTMDTPHGPNLNIVNPFLQLTVPFLKTTQNFSVSILIFGIHGDIEGNFSFVLTDETEEGEPKEITKLEGNLPKHSLENVSSVNLNVDLKNVILENEGKHKTTFYIDGNKVTETDFYVVINEVM